jgi:pyrroloquinoline quinone biosynthesis protein D
MAQLSHDARPRLARGCRLRESSGADSVLLMPERALKVNGTALRVLQLCDGQRTLAEILAALAAEFPAQPPGRLETETIRFLERLREKRAVDLG